MKLIRLDLSWSVSYGRDTYGYKMCRLDDTRSHGKRYRCLGGGYDMVGTVFGDWLQDVYQDRLVKIAGSADQVWSESGGIVCVEDDRSRGYKFSGKPVSECRLYGMTYYVDTNEVKLDGSCGISCMEDIASAIGLVVKATYSVGRRSRCTGWVIVEDAHVG